jgi:hypothetical protein
MSRRGGGESVLASEMNHPLDDRWEGVYQRIPVRKLCRSICLYPIPRGRGSKIPKTRKVTRKGE